MVYFGMGMTLERGMEKSVIVGNELEEKVGKNMTNMARRTKNHKRSNCKHHEMGRQRANNVETC